MVDDPPDFYDRGNLNVYVHKEWGYCRWNEEFRTDVADVQRIISVHNATRGTTDCFVHHTRTTDYGVDYGRLELPYHRNIGLCIKDPFPPDPTLWEPTTATCGLPISKREFQRMCKDNFIDHTNLEQKF